MNEEYTNGWNDAINEVKGTIRTMCLSSGWDTNSTAYEVDQAVDELYLDLPKEKINTLHGGFAVCPKCIRIHRIDEGCADMQHIPRLEQLNRRNAP